MAKDVNDNKKKGVKTRYSIYNLVLIILIGVLFFAVYTNILQNMYNKSILDNEIAVNSSRTDAMHKGVSDILTREDFTEINKKEDMDTERYKSLQSYLNQIRNMNSTRYFYTAKRNAEGKLIYLVDGLDLGADDFAYPGTYIEDEMIPFINRALSGETVYSQEIIDTDWGHIFTACYPVRANDGSNDIIGALCIETDMEPTYEFISERNNFVLGIGAAGAIAIIALMFCICVYIRHYHNQQKKQQEILEQAAEAAYSANRAKSTFLFNMSHDIRTPMNAITGYVELAKKHLNEPDKLSEYMDNISNCGQKLLSLLNNVLDLARIENNKTVIENSINDIDDLFTSCVNMFENTAENKGLTITLRKNLKYKYVYIDETHFSEIVMNIMSNAIKYTGADGEITCAIRQENSEKDGWCNTVFSITDTGIGMSEDYISHIFEAFSRERTSTVSGVDGAGLGMGIVKKLVDLMNGEIKVESALGEGSKFTVTIPCRISSGEEAHAKRAVIDIDKTVFEGKRILLAEDNDLNAEIATELLSDEGLVIERAKDGVNCVEKLEKAPGGYYDIILMDIQMPIMNGYEAAAQIRRLDDLKKANIPIVALTANAFSEDKDNAIKAGMNDHVPKPIDMNVLLPVIQKLVNSK